MKKKMSKQNDLLECNICHWIWRQAKKNHPKTCPNCKSYFWDESSRKKHFSKKQLEIINNKRYREFYRRAKILLVLKTKKGKTKINPIPLFKNPFPEDIKINYHHINDVFVIPIPEVSHKIYPGVWDEHRELTNRFIENIYGFDLDKIIGFGEKNVGKERNEITERG
ncbi:MAG TPA: hypothetical protein VMY59_09830 [Candidatus Thermoplasmatota archaeon]|nr:hypothetical protein [Candidatus Thermoplasmatota archaeon]